MTQLKQARYFEPVAVEPPANGLKSARQYADNQFQPTPAEAPVSLKKASGWWWRLAGLTLLAVVMLSVWQWLLMVQQSWQHSILQGAALTVVSLAVLVLLAAVLWREFRLWRRIAKNRQWQQSAQRIHHSVQYGEADALCEAVAKSLPKTAALQGALTLWRSAVKDEHSDEEKLALFERFVLTELDQQAQQLIYRAATDTSLAVAISPFALADMLLVLWRSSRLLRELAQLYGAAIGQLRSIVLLKRLLAALLWAGGSELALDMASDVIGSELTAKLSARAGQGVIAGLLVARLGNLAQQQLRPLPVGKSAKVSIKTLAGSLMQRFKTAAQAKTEGKEPAA